MVNERWLVPILVLLNLQLEPLLNGIRSRILKGARRAVQNGRIGQGGKYIFLSRFANQLESTPLP